MVLGITGGIGSGKSLVAEEFCKYPNTIYYHADIEAKRLMNTSDSIRNKLIQAFGDEAYKQGVLDRQYISSVVFNNKEKLHILNSIVHPVVREHFVSFIKENESKIIVYENAILFEIQSDFFCDIIIHVTANYEDRISRVIKRDHAKREEVESRIKNQWSDSKKSLLSNYLIFNSNKEATLLKVKRIHNFLTKKQDYF